MHGQSFARLWSRRRLFVCPKGLLRRAGQVPSQQQTRWLAEELEQRVMLAIFNPGGLNIGALNASSTFSRNDRIIIDINPTGTMNDTIARGPVTSGSDAQKLNGALRLRLGAGSLSLGQRFDIATSADHTLSGNFAAIEGLEANSTYDFVAIQGPDKLSIVVTNLPAGDFTIVAKTQPEAEQLITYFSRNATTATAVGRINGPGFEIRGNLLFANEEYQPGFQQVLISLLPDAPSADAADKGRLTFQTASGFSLISVFGHSPVVTPGTPPTVTPSFTLRKSEYLMGASNQGLTFNSSQFTRDGYSFGGLDTILSPADRNIGSGTGPIQFLGLNPTVSDLTFTRAENGDQVLSANLGLDVDKISFKFKRGRQETTETAGNANPGGVKAEVRPRATGGVDHLSGFYRARLSHIVPANATTDEGNAVTGGAGAGFGFAIGSFELDVPNVLNAKSDAFSVSYDADAPRGQTIVAIESLTLTFEKIHLTATLAPTDTAGNGLEIYDNGFQFGAISIMGGATLGGDGTQDPVSDVPPAQASRWKRLSRYIQVKDPSLTISDFGMRVAENGTVTGSPPAGITLAFGEIKLGTSTSIIRANGMNVSGTLISDSSGVPVGFLFKAGMISFMLSPPGRPALADFITLTGTNITVGIGATDSEYVFQVGNGEDPGVLSATVKLGGLINSVAAQQGSALDITGSVGNFAIKGDGTFVPFSLSTPDFDNDPMTENENTFFVSLGIVAADVMNLFRRTGGTGANMGSAGSGMGVPDSATGRPPSSGALNVAVAWPDFNTDAGDFLLTLDAGLQFSVGPLTATIDIEGMVFDSTKFGAGEFPIIGLQSITGEVTGTVGGTGFTGTIIVGMVQYGEAGNPPVRVPLQEDLLDDMDNPIIDVDGSHVQGPITITPANKDEVKDSVLYFGGRAAVHLPNGWGVDLMLGFSEAGFLQAYIRADLDIPIPETGISITSLRGGITFHASALPEIDDPASLRAPVFNPPGKLTNEQWESSLRQLVINQHGGDPSKVFKVNQVASENWTSTLDNQVDPGRFLDPGLFLPAGLRTAFLNKGIVLTNQPGIGAIIKLKPSTAAMGGNPASGLWLLKAGGEYLIEQEGDAFTARRINFSIAAAAIADLTPIDTTAAAVPESVRTAFKNRRVELGTGATVHREMAGSGAWIIDDGGMIYSLTITGETTATQVLVVQGGSVPLSMSNSLDPEARIRIDAGFTLTSTDPTGQHRNDVWKLDADGIFIIRTRGTSQEILHSVQIVLIGSLGVGTTNPTTREFQANLKVDAKAYVSFASLALSPPKLKMFFLADLTKVTPAVAGGTLMPSDEPAKPFFSLYGQVTLTLPDDMHPSQFGIKLEGSRTEGLAVFDAAGLVSPSASTITRTLSDQKVLLGKPTMDHPDPGYIDLSFSNSELTLGFYLNLSLEGTINAENIAELSGKFTVKFDTYHVGSIDILLPTELYGAATFTASTATLPLLASAGIKGDLHAKLKLNTAGGQRTVVLDGTTPIDERTIVLPKQYFGLFADASLTFDPPVVGAAFHPTITGAFGIEAGAESGVAVFIIGTMPLPIPAAAAAGLTCDIIGLLKIQTDGKIGARLELGVQNDPAQAKYFSIGAALQFYMNNSGTLVSYMMPADIASRLGRTLPASMLARLNALPVDHVTDGVNIIRIDVPASAPLIDYSTTGHTSPNAGAYLVVQGFGHIFVGTPSASGGMTTFLDIDGYARLSLEAFRATPSAPFTTQFMFELHGDVQLGSFSGITIDAGVIIALTFDTTPLIPVLTSVNMAGVLELRADFNVGSLINLNAFGSLRINTFSNSAPGLHDGDRTISGILLPASSVTVQFHGDLTVGGIFKLTGDFSFTNNDEKLEISGSATLDLYIASAAVTINAAVYKSVLDANGNETAHPGLVINAAVHIDAGFYSVFHITGDGRLKLSTRDVPTTFANAPVGYRDVPARISASVPYIKAEIAASLNFLEIVTVSGMLAFETLDDTYNAATNPGGWRAPMPESVQRHWKFSGSLHADVDFFVGGAYLDITGRTSNSAVFYDTGEFDVKVLAGAHVGPSAFNISADGTLAVSYLRNAAGTKILNATGSASIGVNVDIEIPPIDFGPFGTTPPATVANEHFDLFSVTIDYNGNTGELTVTPCVLGDICKTFSIGTIRIPTTERPVVTHLAGGADSVYTRRNSDSDGPVGVWDEAPWTGGTLFLNTGDRAPFRNLSNSAIDEDYLIEALLPGNPEYVGHESTMGQTIKVSSFGRSQIFSNVLRIESRLGPGTATPPAPLGHVLSGVNAITVQPGVTIDVVIDGGADADTIYCFSSGVVTINGMGGNDQIRASGAAGSRIDAGAGDDTITWIAGNNAHVTILGGAGTADAFSAIFPDSVNAAGTVLTPVNDRIRVGKILATEQFRVSKLNNTTGAEDEFVSVESGFEILSIGTGAGSDDVTIEDFDAAGLSIYLDVSHYKTLQTAQIPFRGIFVTGPVYADDTAADTVRMFGGASTDTFTISTPSDNTGTAIQVSRTGARTLSVIIYHAIAGTGERVLIDAAGGNDTITGSTVNTNLAEMTFIGSGGNDTLTGTPFRDILFGDDANSVDTTAGTGKDILRGGAGDDDLYAGGGGTGPDAANRQELYGDAGNDHLYAGAGYDYLEGGADNDTLNAGNGNNVLDGGSGDDALTAGTGDDVFTGGLGTDTFSDAGGNDTLIEARNNNDITITRDAFIVGTVRSSSRAGFADDYSVAGEFELLHNIFEIGRINLSVQGVLTGGAGSNIFIVGDVDGFALVAGVSQNIGQQWRGTLFLDGGEGDDRYVVTIFGQSNALINITDSARSSVAGDSLTIYGSDVAGVQDQFLVRPNFIAALAGETAGVFATADRVTYGARLARGNFTSPIDVGIDINGLRGDDRFVSDDTSVETTFNGGLGRDFFQFGQLFGADRLSPFVALGDEIDTTAVNLTPADAPQGTHVTGYLTDGASAHTTANGGEGEDRFVVFRNIAMINLNGEAGNDTFSVRAFALDSKVGGTASRGMSNIAGGEGADFIEYANNADVNINGGDGLDAIRILGTQFGDTFVVTQRGIVGAGLHVNFVNVESLELHTGDGNDTVYIADTLENFKTVVYGGAGSDHVYIGFNIPHFAANLHIPDFRPGPRTLLDIRGPVLVEGGPGDPGVFGISTSVLLPTEDDNRLPPGTGAMSDHESATDVDILDINDTGATTNDHGVHAAAVWPNGSTPIDVHNLSGLGMGGTQMVADELVPGGISYRRMEVFELQLGSGGETIDISSVSAGTTTVFRGDGGSDSFNVTAPGTVNALLVIYGDSSANQSFSGASGNDLIDASHSGVSGVYSGGLGTDTILAGSSADRIAGGPGNDLLGGGGGDDFIFGDSGFAVDRLTRTTTVFTSGIPTGGIDNLDSVGADTITPGNGRDIVFGDHGAITLVNGSENVLAPTGAVAIARTINASFGGNDAISARADVNAAFNSAGWPVTADGDDLVFGGAGTDTITGGSGNETLLGDVGVISFNLDSDPSDMDRVEIDQPSIGAADFIYAGAGNDTVLGGAGGDTIAGESNNDLIFGDFGLIAGDINLAALPFATPAFAFTSASTTSAFPGAADTITGDSGDDILIGGQGADAISGGSENDDIIGGHNIAGGHDGADKIDAGSGNDAIAGDNAEILRVAGSLNPRFRTLTGPAIYGADLLPAIANTSSADPHGVSARLLTILDHGSATSSQMFGADLIAGGSGDDAIFGQLGDDQIRGDGSLNTTAANPTLQSSTAPSNDGDDYIEGNGGADQIWGDLGQDDLIGGSSGNFGLTTADQRGDGVDTIFGGNGTAIARNDSGDTSATGHARDADVIVGDNGNIFRIVGAGGQFLTFNYDNYSALLRIIPRGVQLLDYTPGGNPATDIGGADTIRGETGDDIIYGVTGNDTLYGDGQDDDLYGNAGNDWLFGGTGDDGILGDDGLLTTARNGTAEPLNGIGTAATESLNSGSNVIVTTIFSAGALSKYARLTPFNIGGDDVAYGGLGNDFIHAGDGLDAASGAEALQSFYDVGLFATRPTLTYSPSLRRFLQFDPGTGLRKLANFFLNFDAFTGSGGNTVRIDDGRDTIFGDHGNDWLVGGTNQDRLFGGMGDDVLNADDNLDTNNGINSSADSSPYNEADIAFGGGGLDRLIANTTNDRLIDWVDQFNQYLTPFTGNAPTVVRQTSPNLVTALLSLGRGSGADQLLHEPNGELGLVSDTDPEWADQLGRPILGLSVPGSRPIVPRIVVSSATPTRIYQLPVNDSADFEFDFVKEADIRG